MLHKEVVDDCGVSGNGGMQMIRWRSSLRRMSMLGLDRFINPIGGLHVLIRLNVSISSSSW
jgi:hypothetical protein